MSHQDFDCCERLISDGHAEDCPFHPKNQKVMSEKCGRSFETICNQPKGHKGHCAWTEQASQPLKAHLLTEQQSRELIAAADTLHDSTLDREHRKRELILLIGVDGKCKHTSEGFFPKQPDIKELLP